MSYFPRALSSTVQRAASTFPAVLVTGPRQAGKTSLLKALYGRTHRYVTFDEAARREQALADPRGFFAAFKPPVILDGFQQVPALMETVKALVDEDRKPGRFLLSGSQVFPLMQGVSQSLAGRVAVLNLLPFSLSEAVQASLPKHPLDQALERLFSPDPISLPPTKRTPALGGWLLRGSYPELRANLKVDLQLWMTSYIQTYLERDVRALRQVGDLNAFSRFLRLCAARTAQVLNFSDLARDAGVTMPTAKAWISVLEASQQIFLVHPWSVNLGKRLVRAPKLYFVDTALAAHLMDISHETGVLAGPSAGPLFETMVVSEWRKLYCQQGLEPSLHYFRTRDGLEVDLILQRDGTLYPIEIKTTATPRPEHVGPLATWLKAHPQAHHGGILLCQRGGEPLLSGIRTRDWRDLTIGSPTA